jgi:hypothetical protein
MSARILRAAPPLAGAAARDCDAPVRKQGFELEGEGGHHDGTVRITKAARPIAGFVAR